MSTARELAELLASRATRNPSEIPVEEYMRLAALHAEPEAKQGFKFGQPNIAAHEVDTSHMSFPPQALAPTNALLGHTRDNAVLSLEELKNAFDSRNALSDRLTSAALGALGMLGIPETSLLQTGNDYILKPAYNLTPEELRMMGPAV